MGIFCSFSTHFLHKQGSRDMAVELLQATGEVFLLCLHKQMAVLDVFHWEHKQCIAEACKDTTKVTEEQLGFRTDITDETGVACLEIYVKVKLSGDCEEQRHVIKKACALTKQI